jgi:hypothetical protein
MEERVYDAVPSLRLLMRRDQVLKLCLNHFLQPEYIFRVKDRKTWLWVASDYSEGRLEEEKFAVRFKEEEIAAEFKQAIDKAQVNYILSISVSFSVRMVLREIMGHFNYI